MRKGFSLLISLSVVFGATAAFADDNGVKELVSDPSTADYMVEFFDDQLDGSSYGLEGGVIGGSHEPTRRTLLRPRTSFVFSLLQSVEQI